MASTSLTAQSLTPDPSFNWFFLLELIVSCILSLFFLLYFNRLFATLLSYGIRAYTWHYYRAYVDIHALQISLLGGRIFFKDIRYHGVNETIFVHGGFITWHYWRRTVERTDLAKLHSTGTSNDTTEGRSNGATPSDNVGNQNDRMGEQGGQKRMDALPCRIAITFYGLEWFIYNRTPAYDSILAGFGHPADRDHSHGGKEDPSFPLSTSTELPINVNLGKGKLDSSLNRISTGASTSSGRNRSDDESIGPQDPADSGPEIGASLSKLLQLLPIKLECTKGAIVIGNENTRSVLTTTFDSASGTIDACNAGALDLYRQIFSFQFKHPIVQMRPNPDFKQNQLAAAKGLSSMQEDQPGTKRKRDFIFNYQLRKRKVWHSIRDLIPYFQTSVESFHVHQHGERHGDTSSRNRAGMSDGVRWVGLSRYLDESSQDDHEGWNAVEYGRFSTILDSPGLSLSYYWDIPGRVSLQHVSPTPSLRGESQNINGAPPPEWGIDIKIDGGAINYGPWADRERVGLQNVFFPNFYRSSQAAEPLDPGSARQCTVFKLNVEINEETTLRIPTREQSKDWQWKGRADAIRGASRLKKQQQQQQPQKRHSRNKEGEKGNLGPDIRPFGWLSLRVAPDSTINYTMDMVASSSGYNNQLTLDLRDAKMSSSVNHGLLWQCPRQLVTCDLPNPLGWNDLRTWNFKVESQDMELFLLRDHIFLITDLVSDWASGPPPDYYTFVPFTYRMNLLFTDFRLFVNVNDMNIISNPSDLDDNSSLIIKGKTLASDVLIPLNKYKPEQNAVEFKVDLFDGGIDLATPVWDTLHTFLQDKSTALLDSLSIDGKYSYFLSTSSDLTDTLVLDIAGFSPRLYLYGFLIRYFMTIRENYFGDEMHFKTLEEFQESAYSTQHSSVQNGINPNRKSNDLDVIVHVTVDKPCVLLPENIYDHLKNLRLSAASLEVDLRFTNYYMDLQLSLSPLRAALESRQPDGSTSLSDTQLFIDDLSIHGHRLFGLPPAEPTYVCNWDFEIGRIIGECSTEFVSCLAAALQSFDLTFDNFENALPPLHPLALHDVTFLRAKIESIHLSVLLDQAAFILSSGSVTTKFNDWANYKFSKRLKLLVPDVTIAAVDRQPVGTWRPPHGSVSPLALFQITIDLKMAQRKWNIAGDRKLQQEHIRQHDQRTHRTPWLLLEWEDDGPDSLPFKEGQFDPPTIAIPSMPEPIVTQSSFMGRSLSRQFSETRSSASSRSFLVSSDTSSVRNGKTRTTHSSKGEASREMETAEWSPKTLPQMDEYTRIKSRVPKRARDGDTYERNDSVKEARSAIAAGDSNPWAMPHFILHKIPLDTSQLPQETSDEGTRKSIASDIDSNMIFSPFEDDGITHTNFFCEFPKGIRGFCTPQFLHVISSLVEELQPSHPIEIIDSLQKEVISDIVGYEKSLGKPKKSTSVAIRVPSILLRLVNSSQTHQNDNEAIDFRDEYTIGLSNLRTEFRTKVERQKDDLLGGIKQDHTIHAAADGLSVSVQGGSVDACRGKAEFNCMLGDTNFWLVTAPTVRSHLQMRAFDTVTSTKSVEHLAFLVRRTTTMFDSVTSSFQHSSSLSSRRLRYLVYTLTQSAAGIPDPTFLTRISYVLRVAPAHLRQHDSWKIISRLRNVYNSLSLDRRRELLAKSWDNDLSLPQNAESTVLSNFDQWRAWDLAHVEKSYIMRRVWGTGVVHRETPPVSISLSSTVKQFRFSIDPGPHESDFIVENLSSAVSVSPQKGISQNIGQKPQNIVILQSYCSSAALRLRWEILDLVEGITKTMSTVTLESTAPAQAPADMEPAKQPELQVVLGADVGSVTLDGINVKLALIGKALRGSLAHQSQNTEERSDNLTVLLSAEACSSEISNRSKSLMLWRIWDPYAYLSFASRENEARLEHDCKIAASCRKLRYDMKEDPLSLAHTADRLIEDEVRYIQQLVQGINLPNRQSEVAPLPKRPAHTQFHVTLFLDDYRMSFSLLPSLTYIISGEVARMSVMPQESSKIEIDFDLKKNSHSFLSAEGDKWNTLSILEIPPINGRVLASLSPNRTAIEVDMTIELIRLEASAVRSLLGALTGPEISHLVSDLKQNVGVLQNHLEDVLALDKADSPPAEPSNGHEILYKARLTMAGTEIHATAPGLNGKKYSADMGLSLGMVQMRLDNGLEQGYPMEYPEFHVDVTRIILDLRKKESSSSRSYGSFVVDAKLLGTSTTGGNGEVSRAYHLCSKRVDLELFAETFALVVDILAHLQERLKTLDLSHEVQRFKKLRQRGQLESKAKPSKTLDIQVNDEPLSQDFFNAMYSLEFNNVQIGWNMATEAPEKPGRQAEDLVFSIKRLDLSNKKKNAAKLRIESMQLQMVPFSADRRKRSLNSALMPELVFNVAYFSTGKELRLAFQAAGKSLDLRATSEFILPASMLRDSIASATNTLREANAIWMTTPSTNNNTKRNLFGNKRLRSVLVDVDFAGATVSLLGKHTDDQQTMLTATLKGSRLSEGKYGQYVQGDAAATATLRAPGVALKVQFEDNGVDDPALNAELKVDASTNVLYPTLVPLIKQMTATVKELMGEQEPRAPSAPTKLQPQKLMQETSLNAENPDTILGRCKVNVGLRICKQEFSLSCQPIARVAATASFNSVYVTVNTVQSDEHGRFLALLVTFDFLQASVKHVYSNESTASFEVKSIIMSLMNSRHLSSTNGVSAILKVSPLAVVLNAKQVQDLLLFREIWVPSNDEPATAPSFEPQQTPETQAYMVQRYQQVAAASAFPWNSTIAIEKMEIQLDLGSTLGKSQFAINNLWLSSKKRSDWEQKLCIGFDSMGIESKGRMSGMVELDGLKVSTSIKWPDETPTSGQTPLIQASIAFQQLQAKASFDYQPFFVANVADFEFFMYNVRDISETNQQRLFSILEGERVQVFCTTLTASQSLALLQAWQRLVQDKQAAYEASLREVERFLRRKSSTVPEKIELRSSDAEQKDDDMAGKAPISLHTGVVVTIKTVNVGAFPSAFVDHQIFKLEALDAQARFAVSLDDTKIHSALGLTLGQLRVALSGVNRPSSGNLEDLSIDEIVSRAVGSRGGTILKVPRLVARMETWQSPGSHHIDYIFQSTFEGKVDVGWNYSRISFIRDMWESHSRALASRLGKPLPPSAVRITRGPGSEGDGDQHDQEKITAVVNVPQSKYTYTALEPPVIETPQLRDMGEATPPLEWIGLQRDKLPNVTHQIIIVTLLEIASEVEDAYEKILGSS